MSEIESMDGQAAEAMAAAEHAAAAEAAPAPPVSRRQFLGGVAGVTAGALASGVAGGLAGGLMGTPAAEAAEISPLGQHHRAAESHNLRVQASAAELNRGPVFHPTNGDEELYPNFLGNFTKTLPHNALGEVDPGAYRQLLDALATGSFDDVDAVPAGGTTSFLNPLGGLAYTMDGADSPAIGVVPPPPLASAELAAQAAELYWMALLRDVPFTDYGTSPLVAAAAQDLGGFSGYTGPRQGGQVTPQVLFRLAYPGVLDGPMVSQFLLRPFSFDGIPIDPKISTAAPGQDFLTHFDEWLTAQRGLPLPGADPRDPVLRYPRNVRDLGRTAGQDRIYSQYFKAALIASGFGGGVIDDANPYKHSSRQGGFATFGLAHLLDLVGHAHKSERHTWYQKWMVHRFLRPEAFGGRVHNRMTGAASYPIHAELLASPVLPMVFDYNRDQNRTRLGIDEGSYLLPQMFVRGGPTHPSFPAGHAVSAGACVTMLKAWFREDFVVPNPVKVSADGLTLEPYVVGVDGPALTLGGELNKLAHNLSIGRDMSGVHWRADDLEGNLQGEEVALRILREEKKLMPEYPSRFAGFTLTKFNGTTVTV